MLCWSNWAFDEFSTAIWTYIVKVIRGAIYTKRALETTYACVVAFRGQINVAAFTIWFKY
ncbi:hypothetical protein GCM10007852_03350 [Agaribacter marinus]|uniref:Uncharacterized protein n=1 Tax=Agaribacter marinus TaxID=1431249 RepID=A0AA37SUG1_9ALTE|nr:hypothetical protein GCM10007852_03350 [Agaribacter marinus]